MKTLYITIVCLFFSLSLTELSHAQCTPGDSLSCPDPENNGQVCPDSLPDAHISQYYNQEFTILPPTQYQDTNSGITVNLHHLKIVDVGNLPPGMTWVSNAPDSIFWPGIYYCVLIDGIPIEKGDFPLEITVEVTILFGNIPILYDTIVDSTSLSIAVTDPSGIYETGISSLSILEAFPNPFYSSVDILFKAREPGEIFFEIYNLLGEMIHSETIVAKSGENRFTFDGTKLNPGFYFCCLYDGRSKLISRIIKTE